MKRAAGCWLTLTVVFGGCTSPRPPQVYVDLQRAMLSPTIGLEQTVPTQPPAPPAGTSAQLDPLAARRLDFSENASRLAKVQEEVRIAQEETIRQLTIELRRAYLKDVDDVERRRMSELSIVRTGAFDKVWAQIRMRFQRYAEERGPDAIRLAVYAGFPDPDRVLLNPRPEPSNARRRQLEVARGLQVKLTELDAQYETDIRELLAQADDEVGRVLNELRLEMEQRRNEAEERARDEANRQSLELVKDLESVLSGKSEVILPPKPGVRVQTLAPPALGPPPHLNPSPLARRSPEAVRSEIEIWAAQRGFRVTMEPGPPDHTDEFLAWRRHHHPGP